MRHLLLGQWFTAARVLLVGVLAAIIFLGVGEDRLAGISMLQVATAVACVAVGVNLGFWLMASPRVLGTVAKIGAHHYSLIGGVGFVLLALWAYEGGGTWPLILWFLPAAVLESVVSNIGRGSAQNAS